MAGQPRELLCGIKIASPRHANATMAMAANCFMTVLDATWSLSDECHNSFTIGGQRLIKPQNSAGPHVLNHRMLVAMLAIEPPSSLRTRF
jgi:hypothetical protein